MEIIQEIQHAMIECAKTAKLVFGCKHQTLHLMQRILVFEVPLLKIESKATSSKHINVAVMQSLLDLILDATKLFKLCDEENFLVEIYHRSDTVRRFRGTKLALGKIATDAHRFYLSNTFFCISSTDINDERLDWVDSMRILRQFVSIIKGDPEESIQLRSKKGMQNKPKSIALTTSEEAELKMLEKAIDHFVKMRPTRPGLHLLVSTASSLSGGICISTLREINAEHDPTVKRMVNGAFVSVEDSITVQPGFGNTYRGVVHESLVSCKKVDRVHFKKGYRGMREAMSIQHLASTNCQFLHPILTSKLDIKLSYWVSELAPLGSLQDLLFTEQLTVGVMRTLVPLTGQMKLSVLHDVCNGLEYLHSQGIVHGRLKPSNVLLYSNYRAKLSDYGLQTLLTETSQRVRMGLDGYRYMAPELVRNLEMAKFIDQSDALVAKEKKTAYDEGRPDVHKMVTAFSGEAALTMGLETLPLVSHTADMYSFGCVMFAVVSRTKPFASIPYDEAVWTALLKGETPSLPTFYDNKEELGDTFEDLIQDIISGNPLERPGLITIMQELEKHLIDYEYASYQNYVKKLEGEEHRLREEISGIRTKVNDECDLVSKGKLMISKKEATKENKNSLKERREVDEACKRARSKLEVIEKDILEMEEEIMEINELLSRTTEEKNKVERDLQGGKAAILRHRCWTNMYDTEALLKRYVFPSEENKIREQMHAIVDGNTKTYREVDADEEGYGRDPLQEMKQRCSEELKDFIENCMEELPDEIVDEDDKDGIDWKHEGVAVCGSTVDSKGMIQKEGLRELVKDSIKNMMDLMVEKHYDDAEATMLINKTLMGNTVETAIDSDDEEDEVRPGHRPKTIAGDEQFNGSAMLLLQMEKYTTSASQKKGSSKGSGVTDTIVPMGVGLISKLATSAASGIVGGNATVNSGAALFALKNAYRILATDAVAQYLVAQIGSIDEGVGYRLNGHGLCKKQAQEYITKRINPLHIAAKYGHHILMDEFIKECHIPVGECDISGQNILHYACMRGHLHTVIHIIEHYTDIDVDATNESGFTALALAVISGFLDITKYIIGLNEIDSELTQNRLNFKDPVHNADLLHWSVMSGRLPIVDYFVCEMGFSLEYIKGSRKKDCGHVLLWTAFSSSLVVLKYITETMEVSNAKLVRDSGSQSVLHYASLSGSLPKVTYLIKKLGSDLVNEKDINNNKPNDITCSDVIIDYLTMIKKNSKKWL